MHFFLNSFFFNIRFSYLLRELNGVYSLLCSFGRVYKDKTCSSLKVNLEEYWKAVCRDEIEKSGMADHIWKLKGNHLAFWDQAKIIVREEHWKIRRVKEAEHMLGYSIDMNTI